MGAAPSSPIAGGRASSCATSRPERFALPPPALAPAHRRALGRTLPPIGVGLALALTPTPEGLTVEAWHYFALFAAVIIAIVTEPIPAAVVGLAGVVTAAMLGLVQPTPALSTPRAAALSLAYTLGLMGILTPYATGPAPVYYTCGFIRKRDFWWFGLVMGSIFLACYLLIGLPWLMLRS